MQYILLCMSGFFYSTSCCEFHLCGCTQQVFFLLKLFNSIAVLDCTTVYLFCCLWKFVLFPPVAIMNRVMTSLYIYCDKYKHASLYGIYSGKNLLGCWSEDICLGQFSKILPNGLLKFIVPIYAPISNKNFPTSSVILWIFIKGWWYFTMV